MKSSSIKPKAGDVLPSPDYEKSGVWDVCLENNDVYSTKN